MIKFIKKYFGIAILTLSLLVYVAFKLTNYYYLNNYYSHPRQKDIYIFNVNEKFEPYYLDSIAENTFYFFSHKFEYKNAIPNRQQIIKDSFNNNIYYIYAKSELLKLYNQNKIIKIYR